MGYHCKSGGLKMRQLTLTQAELDYLELILHNHEYEESDRHLIDSLEHKFYNMKSGNHQTKVTTIGG